MGTRAEAADLTRLQTAIAEVRSDAADIYRKSWVIVGHVDNNPLVIDVLSHVSLTSVTCVRLFSVNTVTRTLTADCKSFMYLFIFIITYRTVVSNA